MVLQATLAIFEFGVPNEAKKIFRETLSVSANNPESEIQAEPSHMLFPVMLT